MRTYKNDEIIDAVVIGTGAGGAPLLARLAKAGLKVVALEAGKNWSPKIDFATDEREQNKLFWNFERLSGGGDPIGFGKNNSGIGVGGSTLHYTAYTPRPQPHSFELYSYFGVGNNWPIGYTDLEPYFEELEQFLGISGPSPYPWGPARKKGYPLPPLPLNGPAQLMQRGCNIMGIKTSPAANAALSADYFQEQIGWRKACTNRGFCQAGCSTGAKASMDVTYIPYAIYYGAEVRAECMATAFEKNSEGEITGVVYKKYGNEERQLCRNVFICAGAIETPRLLLMNNLANSSGQVGKNFLAHVGLQVWGEFDENVRPYKGIPGGLISEDMVLPTDVNFSSGYLIQSIGVMPVTYATQLARAGKMWGEELRKKMRSFNQVAGINMHGECLSSEKNYLELSDEEDEMGLPKPRILFTAGENEKKMSDHGEKVMRQIWKEAGAKNLLSYHRKAHTLGTCRMGNNREEAVVNKDGNSYDVPNLFICDGSVFATSLSVNPALTIMALSLRTADLFLQKKQTGAHS